MSTCLSKSLKQFSCRSDARVIIWNKVLSKVDGDCTLQRQKLETPTCTIPSCRHYRVQPNFSYHSFCSASPDYRRSPTASFQERLDKHRRPASKIVPYSSRLRHECMTSHQTDQHFWGKRLEDVPAQWVGLVVCHHEHQQATLRTSRASETQSHGHLGTKSFHTVNNWS